MSEHFKICQFIIDFSRGSLSVNQNTSINVFPKKNNTMEIHVHELLNNKNFVYKTNINETESVHGIIEQSLIYAEQVLIKRLINNCKDSWTKVVFYPYFIRNLK